MSESYTLVEIREGKKYRTTLYGPSVKKGGIDLSQFSSLEHALKYLTDRGKAVHTIINYAYSYPPETIEHEGHLYKLVRKFSPKDRLKR